MLEQSDGLGIVLLVADELINLFPNRPKFISYNARLRVVRLYLVNHVGNHCFLFILFFEELEVGINIGRV